MHMNRTDAKQRTILLDCTGGPRCQCGAGACGREGVHYIHPVANTAKCVNKITRAAAIHGHARSALH
jgi:hypothetical protein